MADLLKINGLNFAYADNKIFNDLSFLIEKNSINAVLGPNNCGKTTLFKILLGVLQFEGKIELDGVVLNKDNYSSYIKKIAIVLSRSNLKYRPNNVHSLFESYLQNKGYRKKEIRDILNEINNIYDIRDLYRKKFSTLSKIEKLKLLIILSIVEDPKLLLLDDIYDDLSKNEFHEIILLIQKIMKEKDITILYTTTKLDMCMNCDNIIFINDGKVELQGDFSYISNHDNILVRNGINISIMLDLSLKLKFYNLIDEPILEPDRMVDKLWQ